MIRCSINVVVILKAVFILTFLGVSTSSFSAAYAQDETGVSVSQDEGQPIKTRLQDYLRRAKRYYLRKKYDLALQEWQSARELDPDNATIQKYIDKVTALLAKQEAVPEPQVVEAPQPPAAEPPPSAPSDKELKRALKNHIRQGERYYSRKQYDLALQEWQSARELDPDNATINQYIQVVEKAFQKKEDERKRAKFKEHIRQGERYYIRKKYDLALQEWEAAQVMDPNNELVQNYIAEVTKTMEERIRKPEEKNVVLRVTEHLPKEPRALSLDECIDIAVKNNLGLQVAKKQLKLANMRVWEARRALLGKMSVRYEDYGGKVSGEHYLGRKYIFDIQQPLYRGGELYFVLKQADINYKVVKNDYERLKNELVLKVKKAYFTIGKSLENVKIQEWLFREVGAISDRVEEMFKGEVCSRGEYLNVKSQEAQIRYQMTSAQQDIETSKLILQQAMSLDPDSPILVNPELQFTPVDVAGLSECTELALINRPEIKINNLMVEYYAYEKKLQKAKEFPSIDFMGSYGQAGEEFVTSPEKRIEPQWYGGLKFKAPIFGNSMEYSITKEHWPPVVSTFQGTEALTKTLKLNILDELKVYADKQEADVEYDRARQEFERTTQDIVIEVQESFYSYKKALLQLDVSNAKVQYHEQDLEFIKLRRGFDEVQDSVVIDGMIRYAQEKFGYVQALADYYMSISSLNKAIGLEHRFKDH